MRASDMDEKTEIMMTDCKDLGKDKQMVEMMEKPMMAMIGEQMMKWDDVKDMDFPMKMRFWNAKYEKSEEMEKMKALKNLCVIMMQEEEKH